MAVIGNQGGGGLIYDTLVNTSFSSGSYIVPADRVFRGTVGGINGVGVSIDLGALLSLSLDSNNPSSFITHMDIEIGGGVQITRTGSGTIAVVGALYKNA